MGVTTNIAEGLGPLVDLIYPPRCPLCGDATAVQGGLCLECWSDIAVPGKPACKTCARPIASHVSPSHVSPSHVSPSHVSPSHASLGGEGEQCWMCREEAPRHSGVVAATIYNDASRQLVLRYKHGRKIALSRLLGQMMAQHLDDAGADDSALLIPVPLHRVRLWERGFNQSALLARELAARGKGALLVDGLVRRKRTPSLGGLGREARREALKGAIVTHRAKAAKIAGRDIILVDDVLTSGATANACVDALLGGGAKTVRIACFARVIDA